MKFICGCYSVIFMDTIEDVDKIQPQTWLEPDSLPTSSSGMQPVQPQPLLETDCLFPLQVRTKTKEMSTGPIKYHSVIQLFK